MSKITLNSSISVDTIREDSQLLLKFCASDEELQDLSQRFGLLNLKSLTAEFSISKSSQNCWEVFGNLRGDVEQACRVTGVSVGETVDFMIEERYVRFASNLDEVDLHLDDAEPLENGLINIGEMLAQSLAVAVTPWPRATVVPEAFVSDEESLDHPFAGLVGLKNQPPR